MSNTWVTDLRNRLFTLIKAKSISELNTTYPDIFYTTSAKTPTTTKFPTVYVDLVSMVENGMTSENKEIDSVIVTIQIKIVTQTSETDALDVANVLLDTMKGLGFRLVSSPDITISGENIYEAIARYRMNIASDDVI